MYVHLFVLQKELSMSSGVIMGFPGGSDSKEPASTCETQVGSLGQEDALEKGMSTHSSILAWRTPRTEKIGGLSVHGVTKSWTCLSD